MRIYHGAKLSNGIQTRVKFLLVAVYRKKNNLLAELALLTVTTIAPFAKLHIKFPTILMTN